MKGEKHRSALFRKETALRRKEAASSSSASFSHFGGEQRRSRNTSDCLQRARDHGKETDNRGSPFSVPTFLCGQIFIDRETSGKKAVNEVCSF